MIVTVNSGSAVLETGNPHDEQQDNNTGGDDNDAADDDGSTAEPPLHWTGPPLPDAETTGQLQQLQELTQQVQAEFGTSTTNSSVEDEDKKKKAELPAFRRRAAGVADDDCHDDTLQPQRPTRITCQHCQHDIQNVKDPSTVVVVCDDSKNHKFCQTCVVQYVQDWLEGRAVYALRRGRRGAGRGLYALPCMLAGACGGDDTTGTTPRCKNGCLQERTLRAALSPDMMSRYREMIFQVRAGANKSRSLAEVLGGGALASRRMTDSTSNNNLQGGSSQSLSLPSSGATTSTLHQSQSQPNPTTMAMDVARRSPSPDGQLQQQQSGGNQKNKEKTPQKQRPDVVMVVDPRSLQTEQQKDDNENDDDDDQQHQEQSQLLLEMKRMQRELLQQQQDLENGQQQELTAEEVEERQLLMLIEKTKGDDQQRLVSCKCCYEDVNADIDVLVFCNGRGDEAHSFCAKCVRLYIEQWLFGGAAYQLRPPDTDDPHHHELLLLPCLNGHCPKGVLENDQVQLALTNRMMEQYEEKLVTCREKTGTTSLINMTNLDVVSGEDGGSDDAAANTDDNEEARLLRMAMRLSLEHEEKRAALREMAMAQRLVSKEEAAEIGLPAEALDSASEAAVVAKNHRKRRTDRADTPAPVELIYEQSLCSTLSSLTTPNFPTTFKPQPPPRQSQIISSPYQLGLPMDIPLPEPLPMPDPLPPQVAKIDVAAKLKAAESPPRIMTSESPDADDEQIYERKRIEVEEVMTEAKVRECPTCHCKFLKDEEFCNKHKCPSCRTAMCYICRLEVPSKGYDHFCIHKTGGCGECGKCALWTKEAEDLMRDEEEMRARGLDKANQIWAESLLETQGEDLDDDEEAPGGMNEAQHRLSRGSEIRIDVDELLKKPASN